MSGTSPYTDEIVSGGATQLNELTDVVITGTPNDNDALAYDTATGKFIPQALAGGGGATQLNDLTDVTISGLATGHTLYYNGTNFINSDALKVSPTIVECEAIKLRGIMTTSISSISGLVPVNNLNQSYKYYFYEIDGTITGINPSLFYFGSQAVVVLQPYFSSTNITINGSTSGFTGAKINFDDIVLADSSEIAVLCIFYDGTYYYASCSKYS